jgi:hypothetical protein
MTDKELLELAAKAAGYEKYTSHWLGRDSFVTYKKEVYSEFRECRVMAEYTMDWNPLTDDGDALRLAVKLKIPIQFPDWENMTRTWGSKNCLDAFDEPHNDNPYAATRHAITRAAAEIGRSME